MAKATETALGADDRHPIADNGYFAGSEILTYHRAGITTTVPRPEINRSNGMFVSTSPSATSIAARRERTDHRYTREEGGLQVRL